MTIQITGSLVANNARNGTLVGLLSVDPPHSGITTYDMLSNPNAYFTLSADGRLYVAWIGNAVVGNYAVNISAHGAGWAETRTIVVRVVAVPVGLRFFAPNGSTLTKDGWRVTDTDGSTIDVKPPVAALPLM